MGARRKPADGSGDDVSLHELIDGPTEALSAETLAAAGMPDPGGRTRVELPRMPAAGALHRRALLGALPGLGGGRRGPGLPAVELATGGVTVDRAHLADYDRVCGFRLTDRLPATFPHVMGFPLALRLMTAPEFPSR